MEKKLLDQRIFEDCLSHYTKSDGHTKFWPDLALKYNFKDGEDIRDKFKKERKRRGIPSRDQRKDNVDVRQSPRIFICDIETLPGVGFYFNTFQTNISIDQIIQDTCMLGWAGKFLNEPKMYSDIMTSDEAKKRDTKRITKSIWDILSTCDIVVGHNFQSFDRPYINGEFLKHGMSPLKYIVLDTLLTCRQNFKFDSNKLAYVNRKLKIRQKQENEGFPLWAKCHFGEQEALDTMKNYNEGDISSTEDLFFEIRPYIRNFNIALYNELSEPQCPVCGSTNLLNEGSYFTSAGRWQSIRCQDCKSLSRAKENLLTKEKKKSLLINS